MSSEEKGDIIYEVSEIHEEKADDGEELDELENIRREVEMIKEGTSDNPRKIQIPLTRIVRNDELGEVLHVEEGEQLLHIDSATMEAAQGLVEEIIQQEEEEEGMEEVYEELDSSAEAALQLQASGVRQKLNYRVVSDDTYQDVQENGRTKIDKDDPRSRLHFVKYMKKDGKTVKIWECGICTKEFRHQYTLMRHLPTHTDERNFKCETCGKAFRQMSTLSQHRAIHSDARPYICEFCKKTFNRVSTLISHRKTHSEHKPHTCDLCGKGFHQKGNLRNHIFTHTNERPYKCEVCGKGFNQMSNLMCHKVKLCDTEFPKRISLKSHQEFKHGIKFRIGQGSKVDQQMLQTLLARKKKKDGKNLRIIHLPNGDRTLADVRNISAVMQAHSKARVSQPSLDTETHHTHHSTAGVIIDPIQTKAMMTARAQGQTPFALLKPAKGIPVLVKVMSAPNNKQMLVPATAEDLKSAGKVTVSPDVNSGEGESMKAVQIKVPVVATVIQRVLEDGQLVIEVEPPSSEQQQKQQAEQLPEPPMEVQEEEEVVQEEDEMTLNEQLVEDETDAEQALSTEFIKTEPDEEEGMEEEAVSQSRITYVREDGTIIPADELADLNPVNLLAAAVNLAQQQPDNQASQSLLELASNGIQFVRPGEDGTYEILSQEEATQMMSEGGQAIEIVGDEQSVAEVVGEEGEEESHTNLSALVEAIRSAGYEVADGQKQIVISGSDGEQVLLDENQQIMFGESGEIIVMGEDGQQVQYVLQEEEEEEDVSTEKE